MADKTKIEWTDATWNPITGCSVTSSGCTNCYAMRLAGTRLQHHPSRAGLTQGSKAGPVWTGEVRLNEDWLTQPLKWKRPRRIFVCAHGDLFHENVPDEWIARVFAVMALAPQHTFQVLTKRAERMHQFLWRRDIQKLRNDAIMWIVDSKRAPFGDRYYRAWAVTEVVLAAPALPNVWLGISVEDQERADERVPYLLTTPAAVRWISTEPLLGPLDLQRIRYNGMTNINALTGDHGVTWPLSGRGLPLDWVVVGGESGPGARPMHPDWACSLRDQCAAAGVPFLFKQWGEWAPVSAIPETDEVDAALYHRPRFINGPRRCKVEQCILQASGRRFDMDCWSLTLGEDPANGEFAFRQGSGAMHFFRTGKKAAGRLLDGVQHDGYPEGQP